jgi:FKBP-type peptidyl-prolyl cis-trans isomerase FklB
MKRHVITVFSILLMGVLYAKPASAQSSNTGKSGESSASNPQAPASSPAFKSDPEKVSYALGMRLSGEVKRLQNLPGMSTEIDANLVAQGLKDALSGKALMTDNERNFALAQLQQDIILKEKQLRQQEALAALEEGKKFLEANKAKEGVVALPSGLQYRILTPGTGPIPNANDSVAVNYRGTLLNGKEFDSSAQRGGPQTVAVFGVIRGWTEALLRMPVGSKWQIFVPPDLAYEDHGSGKDIGPNATLIFELELLSIQGKENQKTPPK